MALTPPTLNSNPVILDVDNVATSKKAALTWSAMLEDEKHLSAEDRSILLALSSVKNGQGVSLLKNLGLDFDNMPAGYGLDRSHQPVHRPALEETSAPKKSNPLADEPVGEDEVFEIVRNIQDPEHPLTLEQLGVVSRGQIEVHDAKGHEDGISSVKVRFTPTIPHCSMATQIGLCIRVKLQRSLPANFKTTVKIEPGTHASEKAVNKQLNDKERVCAALENKHLLGVVNRCIANGMLGQQ